MRGNHTRAHTMGVPLVASMHHLGIGVPSICIPRKMKNQELHLERMFKQNEIIVASEYSRMFWSEIAKDVEIHNGHLFRATWVDMCNQLRLMEGCEIKPSPGHSDWDHTGVLITGSFFSTGWYKSDSKCEALAHSFHRHLGRAIVGKKMKWKKRWIDLVDYRLSLFWWSDLQERAGMPVHPNP